MAKRKKTETLWLTGLPCSGKTTIARQLEKELTDKGYEVAHLDGDDVRSKLNKDLGFSKQDRKENLRRIAHVAELLDEKANVDFVIASFVSPRNEYREMIDNIIKNIKLIYVKCSVEECERRDVKGMYKKAREGEIDKFTGIDAPFEEPESPDIIVDSENDHLKTCVNQIMDGLDLEGDGQDEGKSERNKIDIEKIKQIAKEAGQATLEIYQQDFDVEYKHDHEDDDSPLTKADKRSNEIITSRLKELYPDIPILSEESEQLPYDKRKSWDLFWLIDPLDGTKEFIKKNGEFTINIALVKDQEPVLGVVYIPVKDAFYYTEHVEEKAFRQVGNQKPEEISNRETIEDKDKITVMASKSHFNKETKNYIESLGKDYDLIRKGSSLKLCAVAEGKADIYPRLGPTMEWDTAASHAIVKAAGKNVYRLEDGERKEELKYNKQELKNPEFVVA